MTASIESSRRVFVLGGTAAAAFVGPLAMARSSGEAPEHLPGAPQGVAQAQDEVGEWESLVGARFLVAGEAGKAVARLAAIARPPADPKRPPELARFQPFTAYLETDARTAPVGQQTYRVTHPIRGGTELFLSRGEDKHGKAILLALFN